MVDLKGTKGFTLLELLMVIIIIGILATLAIPQFTSMAERARVSEAVNTIGAIKTAQDLFHLENNTYTATDADLSVTYDTAGTASFWTYGLSGATASVYTVTATRTSRDAGSFSGLTITMTWDDAGDPRATWASHADYAGMTP